VKYELKLRIVLEAAPAGPDFGLQKGHGSDYKPVQVQRSGPKELFFECSVDVITNGKISAARFLGPFVQGPADGKFLYLDIGEFAGQKESGWSRRLKIPLSGITAALLRRAVKGAGLETRVPGIGKDGGPNCGTVKPFAGWRVRRK